MNLNLQLKFIQFIFLSDCGFRFPIAQYPSGACTPSDLYFLFWEGVSKMQEHGFLEVEFYISRLIYSGSFVLCVDIVYTLPVYNIWLGRHPRTAFRTSVWHYIKQFTCRYM